MFSDYRAFAQAPKDVFTGTAQPFNARNYFPVDTGNTIDNGTGGWMLVVALSDCILDDKVMLFACLDPAGNDPDSSVSLATGEQLPGLKSFTFTSGQALVIWFNS